MVLRREAGAPHLVTDAGGGLQHVEDAVGAVVPVVVARHRNGLRVGATSGEQPRAARGAQRELA
jgi:hypothetical protein